MQKNYLNLSKIIQKNINKKTTVNTNSSTQRFINTN